MSRHRINPKAGWAKPNGKCRWCGKDGLGKRGTFCSEACIHEWKIRSQPGYARQCVEQRDKGVCAECGLDTEALRTSMPGNRWHRTKEQQEKLVTMGFGEDAVHRGDFWQADHIVEVVNGGGQTGLENYQTLCTPCHKAKTKRLAHERAMQRRLEREQAKMSLFAGIEA